jgi:hypothetical protein
MINQVLFFTLFSFFKKVIALEGCNLNDIKTIIGGPSYIVKSMIVESLTYSYNGKKEPDGLQYQNMLIAAGNL